MLIKKTIRKHHVGGLGHLADPRIPKAEVEVYLRSKSGETFHVSSLHEGIHHLLCNEGYRLGIYESPDGCAFDRPRYDIVIRRDNDQLRVTVRTPMLDPIRGSQAEAQHESKIFWDLSERQGAPMPTSPLSNPSLVVGNIADLVDNCPPPPPVTEDVEIVIDGTQTD